MREKEGFNEQVGALQSQAKTVMRDSAVPVDERIKKTADIYKQAEKIAAEGGLEDKIYESLLSHSANAWLILRLICNSRFSSNFTTALS